MKNKAIIEGPNEYTSTRDLVLAKTRIISQCACAAANTSQLYYTVTGKTASYRMMITMINLDILLQQSPYE